MLTGRGSTRAHVPAMFSLYSVSHDPQSLDGPPRVAHSPDFAQRDALEVTRLRVRACEGPLGDLFQRFLNFFR